MRCEWCRRRGAWRLRRPFEKAFKIDHKFHNDFDDVPFIILVAPVHDSWQPQQEGDQTGLPRSCSQHLRRQPEPIPCGPHCTSCFFNETFEPHLQALPPHIPRFSVIYHFRFVLPASAATDTHTHFGSQRLRVLAAEYLSALPPVAGHCDHLCAAVARATLELPDTQSL